MSHFPKVVLKQIMLRRRKDQLINGKPLIELPKRTVNVISCPFDTSEKAFYDALEGKMESVIEKLMSKNGNGSNYMSVLLLLLRLRQGASTGRPLDIRLTRYTPACNHPLLISKDYKQDMDAVEPSSAKKGTDGAEADGDDLAAAFDQLGVTKRCQVCTIEYARSTKPWTISLNFL